MSCSSSAALKLCAIHTVLQDRQLVIVMALRLIDQSTLFKIILVWFVFHFQKVSILPVRCYGELLEVQLFYVLFRVFEKIGALFIGKCSFLFQYVKRNYMTICQALEPVVSVKLKVCKDHILL